MPNPCANTVSSNCVDIQTKTGIEFKTQSELNDYVYDTISKIKADIDTGALSLDGTGLSSLNSLIEVTQWLITKVLALSNNTTTTPELTTNVDLKCLSDSCNTGIITQNQFNQIVVNSLCGVLQEVRSIKSKFI